MKRRDFFRLILGGFLLTYADGGLSAAETEFLEEWNSVEINTFARVVRTDKYLAPELDLFILFLDCEVPREVNEGEICVYLRADDLEHFERLSKEMRPNTLLWVHGDFINTPDGLVSEREPFFIRIQNSEDSVGLSAV